MYQLSSKRCTPVHFEKKELKGNPRRESLSGTPTQFLGPRRNHRSGTRTALWVILIACLISVGTCSNGPRKGGKGKKQKKKVSKVVSSSAQQRQILKIQTERNEVIKNGQVAAVSPSGAHKHTWTLGDTKSSSSRSKQKQQQKKTVSADELAFRARRAAKTPKLHKAGEYFCIKRLGKTEWIFTPYVNAPPGKLGTLSQSKTGVRGTLYTRNLAKYLPRTGGKKEIIKVNNVVHAKFKHFITDIAQNEWVKRPCPTFTPARRRLMDRLVRETFRASEE